METNSSILNSRSPDRQREKISFRIAGADKPLLVIGLLGGVASGKSFVAEQFRQLGAAVLDADQAGHDVLRLDEVKCEVRARWGDQVFGANGEIDRQALSKVVFAADPQGEAALHELEKITHPRIGQLISEQAVALADGRYSAVVLDAPVMLKAGWDKVCDKIVYVDAPPEIRLARARQRGWSDAEFYRREEIQENLGMKQSLADAIIDNSTSPESTRAQVERFWHSLSGSADNA